MKQTSKNFIYSIIYQIFTFIIPLVTIPYISRVLGVDNIGVYSYTYSIVSYFMLASMLGINNYGSREIAKLVNNKEEMSKKFFSIYYLQLITNIIMALIYGLFIVITNIEYKNMLVIQLIFLLSCAFDINWFFFGLEEFKITISRNIIIKLLSLVLVFLLVKTNQHLWLYALIMSISTLISQLYLWLFLKKRIIFTKVTFNDIFSNLKQCLILFVPVVAYSIYRIMDKTMIGSLSTITELGLYESAEKIISIPLAFTTALGTIMMPHVSKISSNQEFEETIKYSFKLCFFFLIPMAIGILVISKDFALVFFGSEFSKSALIMTALTPTIIFGGVTNVVRTNYLIPKSQDKVYVVSTILGAIINLVLNAIFIKPYGALGACIGTIITEFSIMAYQIICTKKVIKFAELFKEIVKFLIQGIAIGFMIYFIGLLINNIYVRLFSQIAVAVSLYMIINISYIKYEFFGIKSKNIIVR